MRHEQAAEWIVDMHTGRLDSGLQAEVSAHALQCADCLRVLSVYDALVAALGASPDAAADHPDVDSLVSFAVGAAAFDSGRRARVAEHMERCASCAREIEAVRAAEVEGQGSRTRSAADGRHVLAFRPRPTRAAWRGLGYAAASVAALLLLAFGYAGFRRLPAAELEIAQLQEGLAEARSRLSRVSAAGELAGAVALPLFRGALRAGETPPVIEIGSETSVVPLAVVPSLPRDTPDTSVQRFEILDGSGHGVFELRLTAAELRRLTAKSDVLALLVPAESLTFGPHVLTMTDVERNVVLLQQSFSVARIAGTPEDEPTSVSEGDRP